MAICGIYKIENLYNHKVYIGQSINIEQRWKKHKSINDDLIIHRALKKYGKENFLYNVIEQCPKEKLDERQIYWIKYYNSLTPNGYNMTPGGNSGVGYSKGIVVQQYSLEGIFIKEYPSANQAASTLNLNPANIASCCRGERLQAGLYQWKWKNSDKKIIPIEGEYRNDAVLQYSKKGDFIAEYKNLEEAAKTVKSSKSSICSACKGKIKLAAGFQWKYKSSNKEILKQIVYKKQDKPIKTSHGGVNQYDLNGIFIAYYPTALEAKRQTGVNNSNISQCCKGNRKTAGGFIWIFADEDLTS